MMKCFLILWMICIGGICNAINPIQTLMGKDKSIPILNKDYRLTVDKIVLVDTIVNGLSASNNDIYNLGKSYIEKSYKKLCYKLVDENIENFSVVGNGCLLHFFDYQLGFNHYYLNADITLRIDAKDGRVRVSLLADKYSGECINGNRTERVNDKIAEFYPVNIENKDKKRMYEPAFSILLSIMNDIKREVIDYIQSECTETLNIDW